MQDTSSSSTYAPRRTVRSSLIEPDGGALVELVVPEAERAARRAEASRLPAVRIGPVDLEWVHVVADGWASPLRGFMREAEYLQSLHFRSLRLADGSVVNMSLPIVLAIRDEEKEAIGKAPDVALTSPAGGFVAILRRFTISTCTARYGRYIPVRQVPGTRIARYRVVPSKIDRWRSISVIGGRLKKKSIVDDRLREKSTVNGRLRKKKGRRREKKKEEGKKEYLARASSSLTCRRRPRSPARRSHPRVAYGRGPFFSRARRREYLPARGDRSRRPPHSNPRRRASKWRSHEPRRWALRASLRVNPGDRTRLLALVRSFTLVGLFEPTNAAIYLSLLNPNSHLKSGLHRCI
ncbi:hypothetical protein GW17_00040188 [Ensete ventricosum]|nr:hypothetical protein GW17_00040188 [Ensete ventricosum]